jgi:hypothetical protein
MLNMLKNIYNIYQIILVSIVLLINPLHGPSRKPVPTTPPLAVGTCLPSCYVETALVYLFIPRPLHTRYYTLSIFRVEDYSKQAVAVYLFSLLFNPEDVGNKPLGNVSKILYQTANIPIKVIFIL